MSVVDLACGEGYGSDVLARSAYSVVGVDANPDAHEHARLRYRAPNLRFVRDMVETLLRAVRRRRLPADDRARPGPRRRARERQGRCCGAGRDGVRIDAQRAHAGAAGAERSGNPWHLREYRAEEFRALCAAHFGSVELYGLFHARALRVARAGAARAGGIGSTPRCG